MIQSMTGYGKAEAHCNGKKIHIEIKSVVAIYSTFLQRAYDQLVGHYRSST